MELKARITEDMKTAMRAKDSLRLGTIRLLQAAIKQREVDERITLDDAAVVGVIDKLVKQRKDSIAAFEQAARQDLADQEKAELQILQAYLPERMDEAAIAQAVAAIVAQVGAQGPQDMGKVMAVLKAKHAAEMDMAKAGPMVKAALGA